MFSEVIYLGVNEASARDRVLEKQLRITFPCLQVQ